MPVVPVSAQTTAPDPLVLTGVRPVSSLQIDDDAEPIALPAENILISELAQSEAGEAQLQMPLIEPFRQPLQSMIQGETPVISATGEMVGGVVSTLTNNFLIPSEQPDAQNVAPPAGVSEFRSTSQPNASTALVSDLDQIKTPIAADQMIKKGRDLLTGTLLTVQTLKDKRVVTEESLTTATPVSLIQGISVATVVPILSSTRTNFQAIMANKKSVPEAVEAVTSDAIGAVLVGSASQVGQRVVSSVAMSLKVPPPLAEAAGVVAAFTAGQLSMGVIDYSGLKTLMVDRAKGWMKMQDARI